MSAREIEADATAAQISPTTLKRASKELDVTKQREGFGTGGKWVWSLPEVPSS
jgi:hypothetical protein